VAFFFKQWGGKSNKGGCLIDGSEIKQWPAAATIKNLHQPLKLV
jgi:protein gp37